MFFPTDFIHKSMGKLVKSREWLLHLLSNNRFVSVIHSLYDAQFKVVQYLKENNNSSQQGMELS